MQLSSRQGSLTEFAGDAIIVNLFQGVRSPGGGTGAVDRALEGSISEIIADGDIHGRLGETCVIRSNGRIPARQVVVVGLGPSSEFDSRRIMQAAAEAARKCAELRAKTIGTILHGAGIAGLDARECSRAVALGSILGTYRHTRLKTRSAHPNPIERLEIIELSEGKMDDIRRGIDGATVIGEAVNFARDLANEPSNVVTPAHLADVAQSIADDYGMSLRILDREGIAAAGMGLLTAVSRGSAREPRFIDMRYTAPGAKKTVALIGKGVTFDTGGYCIKRATSMYGMKDDMSGAANVLAAMRAFGKLKPGVNVIALIPATENSVSGAAVHPGDVFTSLDGRSVEINNTDAEGRLIVADAVAWARREGVDEIIDLATLTGACVTALGRQVSGILGNNRDLVRALISAGTRCGEDLWELPLFSDYLREIKSDIADIKNCGKGEAGAIVGALFISEFVGEVSWAHIDLSSATLFKQTRLHPKGATGIGTGTLIDYIVSI